MSMFRTLICALALALSPFAALSHPHIFVDTTLRLVTNASGQITGVEVTWAYDDLYSLLLLEDKQLDGDYDGKLTKAELAQLDGFDMQWVDGYMGDLYASLPAGGALDLSGPTPMGVAFNKGRITTRHLRTLPQPVDQLVLRAYDPTFYTAYDLTGGVTAPEGCAVQVQKADIDAAQARVAEALKTMPADPDAYPEVGDAFADTVQVRCQ